MVIHDSKCPFVLCRGVEKFHLKHTKQFFSNKVIVDIFILTLIFFISACNVNLDIIFAVDCSGTVGEKNFQLMIDFIKSQVQSLPVNNSPQGTRIGVVSFGSTSKVKLDLNKYTEKDLVLNALHFDCKTGSTNAADAIDTVTQIFAGEDSSRASVPNVAVMFLDGKSDDRAATWNAALRSRDQGVHWIVVGVGHMYGYYELEGIVSPPAESSILLVDSFAELGEIEDDMYDILCDGKYLSAIISCLYLIQNTLLDPSS